MSRISKDFEYQNKTIYLGDFHKTNMIPRNQQGQSLDCIYLNVIKSFRPY